MVNAEIPPQLVAELQEITDKDEEAPDAELWTTDSLCFRYFNILQQYKTTKQVSAPSVVTAHVCCSPGSSGSATCPTRREPSRTTSFRRSSARPRCTACRSRAERRAERPHSGAASDRVGKGRQQQHFELGWAARRPRAGTLGAPRHLATPANADVLSNLIKMVSPKFKNTNPAPSLRPSSRLPPSHGAAKN